MFSKTNVERYLYQRSFLDFFEAFWGVLSQEELVLGWHIKYICEQLQEAAFRVRDGVECPHDFVINVPPGTSKSTIVSQLFPAWVWTFMPHAQFICTSYSGPAALKDAIKMRDVVNSELYQKLFPEIKLRGDVDAKGYFQNSKGGWRLSVGTGGTVTGFHAHFVLTDDPINPMEALSEADRLKANDFQEQTLPSRKVNPEVSVMALVMQRLHEDDPAGRLLEKRADRIKHICIPAEKGDNIQPPELDYYYVDGLFDPKRRSKKVLDQIRQDLGEYAYAGQMLQRPVPVDGGIFNVERFDLHEGPPPPMVRRVRGWDKAGSKGKGDYTSGVLLGVDADKRFWVLDVVRGRWSAWEREKIIKSIANKDGRDVEIVLEQEGGSGGKESAESTVRNLAGYRVKIINPTGDKQARAYPFATQVGGYNVSYLKRDWNRKFLDEFAVFPNGTQDDQVDAASSAFNRMSTKRIRVGALV